MAYNAEISRTNPTCFLFLMDQSGSMMDPIQGISGNERKADFIASNLNKILQSLVILASKDMEIRRYYQVGVIGYNGEGVAPILGGALFGKELAWIDELYESPMRVETREKKESDGAGDFITVNVKFPVWFDPICIGRTPMLQAVERAYQILEPWVAEHSQSYPPTVINLTDGEATDGDPRQSAEKLKSLATADGNVTLLTLHVSSNPYSKPFLYPVDSAGLPDAPSKLMFEMSSYLTPRMIQVAKDAYGMALEPEAKAIVYNADIEAIVQALEIGTRPANLR